MEKTVTITIKGANPADCKLVLSDNGFTEVNPGDYVEWVIGPGSGVAEIKNIKVDQGSLDVFDPDPSPVSGTTSWKGRINPNITKVEQENYTIEWVTAGAGWLNQGGGKSCSFDPIIKVSPKN